MTDPSATEQLARLIGGFRVSQAISTAVELGLADLLADRPWRADDLAVATGTHAPSVYRLLRALCSVGVYEQLPDGHFRSTALGDVLRDEGPGSLAGWARLIGRPYFWQAWSALPHSIRSGENAFRALHGEDVWTYRASHPDESDIFDGAMTTLSAADGSTVLDAYDFGRFATIADIGGGRGAFLAAILGRWPQLQGVLADRAHVVERAPDVLDAAGVRERCRIVASDFFERVPPGADAYVLRNVIHDWTDADSVRILSTCRRDMPGHAVVLLVERVLTGLNPHPSAAFSDLNMLVVPGGQERTEDEYGALLTAAGLRPVRMVPTTGPYAVVEAEPA